MTDPDGIITGAFFERNLADRITGVQILRAAIGDTLDLAPASNVAEVRVDASIDGSLLPSGLQRDLVIDFHVPPGQHVYGLPVPEGLIHAHVELDEGPWRVHRVETPPTVTHVLAGTGEELQIYESSLRMRVVVSHNGSDLGDTHIRGEIRWQACDDDQCFLPQRRRVELPIRTGRAKWMRGDGSDEGEHFGAHFARMTNRRS